MNNITFVKSWFLAGPSFRFQHFEESSNHTFFYIRDILPCNVFQNGKQNNSLQFQRLKVRISKHHNTISTFISDARRTKLLCI